MNAACGNKIRLRRDDVERHILGAIDKQLLDPKMVLLMAKEIEREFNQRLAALQQKAGDLQAELLALDGRIARLKTRLRQGDSDIASDEIQAAIDEAEAKRGEFLAARPEAKFTARVLSLLHKAAAACRDMIAGGTVSTRRPPPGHGPRSACWSRAKSG